MNDLWIQNHKHIYKLIEPGEIYLLFENEEPLPMFKAGVALYNYKYIKTGEYEHNKTKRERVSENGNAFITKIGICERCGTFKEGKKIRKSLCKGCLLDIKVQKEINKACKESAPEVKIKQEPGVQVRRHCVNCDLSRTMCPDATGCVAHQYRDFQQRGKDTIRRESKERS